MNLAMCEVPVHQVEFLTEADIAALPELPMTQAEDGTWYCYGESTQEKTTGAQLFDSNKISGGGYDVTLVPKNGKIIVSGKSTSNQWLQIKKVTNLNPGSYTIKTIISGKTPIKGVMIQHNTNESTMPNTVTTLGFGSSYSFALEEIGFMLFYIGVQTDEEYQCELSIMLNAGDTALPWEPYTGGIPSPNPDYPQPIINTYPAGTYRAVCGDKVYKVVLDDDLRSVPGVADMVRIDARRGVCWVERKVAHHMFNENDYFYLHNAGKDVFSFGFREKNGIQAKHLFAIIFKAEVAILQIIRIGLHNRIMFLPYCSNIGN